ncbi:hypothetical protein ACFBZI_02715 [Moraxella sp. ZJ142]|uniref:hypothetical protein n=1 Tax=Moraxella marmotae TaxID=3344520 RepID=UPI0035D4F9CF
MVWSNAMIATVVVLVAAGFLLGNFMAARPKASETRVADFRLMARQRQIFPKLISCPSWLLKTLAVLRPAKPMGTDPYARTPSTPMIAQYTLMIDELALPLAQYVAVDGTWQLIEQTFYTAKMQRQAEQLHGVAVDLPPSIAPQVLGLALKANHIALYWLDNQYQHSHKAYKLDKAQADKDLQALKRQLSAWAIQVHQQR